MKITLVIGLPGSGKSRFLKDKEHVIDDMIHPKYRDCDELWVADPRMCDDRYLRDIKKHLSEVYENVQFECIYFENDLDKCLTNIEHRRLLGDERQVEGLARHLSKTYEPINPIEVITEFVL